MGQCAQIPVEHRCLGMEPIWPLSILQCLFHNAEKFKLIHLNSSNAIPHPPLLYILAVVHFVLWCDVSPIWSAKRPPPSKPIWKGRRPIPDCHFWPFYELRIFWVYKCLPHFSMESAALTLALKKAFEKKSREPIKRTRALLRACMAPTSTVDFPTATGY